MNIARFLFVLLLCSTLCLAEHVKLFLKDGGYHIVREYHVQGDRVRFFSTERGEWEEIPTALVDLSKTEAVAKDNAEQDLKEQREQDAEDQALRDLRREIASVPVESGAYFLMDGKVKQLDAAPYEIVTNKKRAALKMLSPVPLIPGKATVVIKGEHSSFVVHDPRPTFYFRPQKQEQFSIIAVQPKKNLRVVENVSILPAVNAAIEDRRVVKVFQMQLAENLYKVWPQSPLTPGEYAVAEYGGDEESNKDDIDIQVWDFAYRPAQ